MKGAQLKAARTSQRCPASGQNDTSLQVAGGKGLPSEIVPYIVLPQLQPHSNRTFDPAVAIGDVAVVIFKDKTAAALCGEASIRVHEALQQLGCPDPCSKRDAKGFCQKGTQCECRARRIVFCLFKFSVRRGPVESGDNKHHGKGASVRLV
jgi:hypothetical protein